MGRGEVCVCGGGGGSGVGRENCRPVCAGWLAKFGWILTYLKISLKMALTRLLPGAFQLFAEVEVNSSGYMWLGKYPPLFIDTEANNIVLVYTAQVYSNSHIVALFSNKMGLASHFLPSRCRQEVNIT